MAGMKFNADIDLEKIVKLRQEIDKLKKSLIEIASVPNSDAAIKQLESEIDRATKKLSEYKDSYAKLQKIKYDIDSSSSTVKRVKEETSALQSTNKWIIANTESVKEADRQIKQLKKDFSALSDEEKVGDTGTAKIRQIQQLAAQRLVEEEAVRKTIKAQKDQIIQSNAEEGSITALRKQLILLIKDYDDLGRVRRGGDAGKALLTQISNVQKELNAAEQASGRFQRNVGNYASAWNGLGNSAQQVARELPSLAVSANTFFLAISNNLPILVDEIAKARKEYANFKAELKAGNKDVKAVAPVWQQLTRSILSWQTALVVGRTLLSVYGKDVIKWIGSLGKARDVTLDLLSAEQEMALARKSAWSSIAKEQTQLDILYNKLKNVTLSTTERNAAVREWVKNYKTHSDILDGENVDLRKLENAYRALSKEIYANAVARAYADRIAELSVQREKEEMKRLNQKITIAKAEQELERVTAEYNKKANEGFGTATAKLEAKDKIIQARKNVEDQKKIYNDLVNNVNDYDKNITVISNHIKTLDLFPQPKEGTYDYWKQQVEIADDALKQITSEQKKSFG
jgi:chromosome segregation ATPase